MAWTTTAKDKSLPALVFPLFGVPFIIMGLYFVVGRFFADAWMRERTFYGIANERIIIVSGLFSRRTKSLNLRTLSDISLTELVGRSVNTSTVGFAVCLAQHAVRRPDGSCDDSKSQ
jgi:hypothetical protein